MEIKISENVHSEGKQTFEFGPGKLVFTVISSYISMYTTMTDMVTDIVWGKA